MKCIKFNLIPPFKCQIKFISNNYRRQVIDHDKSLNADFKELLLNVDRRRKYEVTFLKCDKCSNCLESSSDSKEVIEFMNAHHNPHFEAKPGKGKHFMTFIEQGKLDVKPTPDVGSPE